MIKSYKTYIPQTLSEIWDMLGSMMLSAPNFRDKTGYFPQRNIETEFNALNQGLVIVRRKLGEENYQELIKLSDQARAHFEADPDDKTEDGTKGRTCIREMEKILKSLRTTNR